MHGGGHGHPDKLALILYAQGSRQAPDLGTPGYGIDLFEGWYRQTISHNTVLLDGLSQPPGAGKCNAFGGDGPFQMADATMEWGAPAAPSENARFDDAPLHGVSSEALDAYAQVKMRRTVLARADYLVDVFLVDAGEVRRIDWIYRNAGELALPNVRSLRLSAPEGEGYEHMTDFRSHALDDDIALTWRLEGSGMRLFMAEQAGTTLFAGRAPGNPAEERQGLVMRQREAARNGLPRRFPSLPGSAPHQFGQLAWPRSAGRRLGGLHCRRGRTDGIAGSFGWRPRRRSRRGWPNYRLTTALNTPWRVKR